MNEEVVSEQEIPENPTPFMRDSRSSFLVKSKKIPVGVWVNPKEWSFTSKTSNSASELEFQSKDKDIYGMLITEEIEIPLETLADIAFKNAQSAAPDIEVKSKEYRTVNGLKVLMMQLEGTIQGIRFVYFGYYYSSEKGTVQFISYTSASLFNKYKDDIEEFLNGFVSLEK